MATPLDWKTTAVKPLGIGGCGLALTWVKSLDPNDPVLEVMVKVGPGPAASIDDPSCEAYPVPITPNGQRFIQAFGRLSVTVSWFARTASTQGSLWIPGPRVDAYLVDIAGEPVPYLKEWVVKTLQASEEVSRPLGLSPTGGPRDKVVIRGAYPRDTFPPPCVSVQHESAPTSERMAGDAAGGGLTRQIVMDSYNILLWSRTPEEREQLAPWFTRALQTVQALSPHVGLMEVTFDTAESEDFSGQFVDAPLFVLSARMSGRLAIPSRVDAGQGFQGVYTC